jgi:excisionase family DNA binding protein
MNNEHKKLMTALDVADLLSMKVSWVRQRVHRDEIPYYKIGNLVRFSRNDINKWLDAKRENS